MEKVFRWLMAAVFALMALAVITVLLFWFTIPAEPTLRDVTAPTHDSTVAEPELRMELLQMRALDRAVRDSTFGGGSPDMESLAGIWRLAQSGLRMRRIDIPNTTRLQAIVAEHGWPDRNAVGEDGRAAIFLVVQHADHDPTFQEEALGPMKEAFEAGDLAGRDLAMLTDRVLVASGELQLYGSQVQVQPGDEPGLLPVADEANVDARRAEMGLSPLSVYLTELCAETRICVER